MSAMFQLSKVDIFMHGNTGEAGKWGSHFWKDCQPMGSSAALEFGGESKSGSEYKNDGGSENDSIGGRPHDREELEGDYEDKEDWKIHGFRPDEMLSDEYYEQDGDDHSDSATFVYRLTILG